MKIIGGRRSIHARIDEADKIGQVVVAKKSMNFPAANPEFPRGIQLGRVFRKACGIAPESDVSRSSKNSFIRGEPAEAQFRGDIQSFVGNRTFRRPQPRRLLPKNVLVIAA